MILETHSVTVRYGGITAVRDVSIRVEPGQLVVILGSNGAGKSSLLKAVAGIEKIREGHVILRGIEVNKRSVHRRVRMGLVLVPEGRMIVAPLSVDENLALSAHAGRGSLLEQSRLVYELFPALADRKGQLAGSLSGGEQQMLAIGRALMTRPDLLLLDEPTMGLSPALSSAVASTIAEIHSRGQSILLVEQNASIALPIADYAYVLARGQVSLEGDAASLSRDERVLHAYLG